MVRGDGGKRVRRKWEIIAAVTPSPLSSLKNTAYLNFLDDHDARKLRAFMDGGDHRSGNKLVSAINIDKKACDVADFLGMWTESQSLSKDKKKAKGRAYNAITSNCQQFAAELFEFLVGHRPEYQAKVKAVKMRAQSPADQKKWGTQQMDSDGDGDDDEKQEIEETDDGHGVDGVNEQKQRPMAGPKEMDGHPELNNPEPINMVHSL